MCRFACGSEHAKYRLSSQSDRCSGGAGVVRSLRIAVATIRIAVCTTTLVRSLVISTSTSELSLSCRRSSLSPLHSIGPRGTIPLERRAFVTMSYCTSLLTSSSNSARMKRPISWDVSGSRRYGRQCVSLPWAALTESVDRRFICVFVHLRHEGWSLATKQVISTLLNFCTGGPLLTQFISESDISR